MTYFAKSLKKLRAEAGMTMQTLSDASLVSKSMICKIEHDEVQPTLDVACRIAKALGKSLSEMLHAPQTTDMVLIPAHEQAVWEDTQHIVRRNISPVFEGLNIEWLQITLPAGAMIEKSQSIHQVHQAEKFILVTQGTVEITLNEKNFLLHQGDSSYFNANIPHSINNVSEPGMVAQFYVVIKHR